MSRLLMVVDGPEEQPCVDKDSLITNVICNLKERRPLCIDVQHSLLHGMTFIGSLARRPIVRLWATSSGTHVKTVLETKYDPVRPHPSR